MYCSSSAYASAHGTPSRKALVLRIHSALPPKRSVDRVNEASDEAVLLMRRRVAGGIMSLRAAMRS